MQTSVLLITFSFLIPKITSDLQKVTVKGTTLCENRRISLKIQLFEDEVTKDELLSEGTSSLQGEFLLKGEYSEVGTIEPYLKIVHSCNLKKLGCRRKSIFKIPEHFITEKGDKIYDMGFISLDLNFGDDEEYCS